MTGVTPLYAHALAAETAATGSSSLDTRFVASLAVDINVTALTGGTSPTIQFWVDRLGADSNWYNVWTSGTTGVAALYSVDIGAFSLNYSYPTTQAQHAVLTGTTRFRWAFGGTANPTSVTFSASVVGRG